MTHPEFYTNKKKKVFMDWREDFSDLSTLERRHKARGFMSINYGDISALVFVLKGRGH
jgi:hypothetical protein